MTMLKKTYNSILFAVLLGASVCLSEEVCTLDHTALHNEKHVLMEATNVEVEVYVQKGKDTEGTGYWILSFNEGQFKGVNNIRAWCVDLGRRIKQKRYDADIVSSMDKDFFKNNYVDAVDKPEILPSVNWLINNQPSNSTLKADDVNADFPDCLDDDHVITDQEFQLAVWTAIDLNSNPGRFWRNERDECVVKYLVKLLNSDDAMSYKPNCTNDEEQIGILVVVDTDEVDEDGTVVTYSNIKNQVLIGEVLLSETGMCKCENNDDFRGAKGDPHFRTWASEAYDFHGVCDLVLLSNPSFENGLGMDIHMRTTRMRLWSYISAASIRIGEDILEIRGGDNRNNFWINGAVGMDANVVVAATAEGNGEETLLPGLSGYPITLKFSSAKKREFIVDLGQEEKIVFTIWNLFVGIHMKHPHHDHFQNSVGLMGSFPKGIKLARDNISIIDDIDIFGQEWQVLASEPKLFYDIREPQQPNRCEIPTKSEMRRRLEHETITLQDAKRACADVSANVMEFCIFDVMVTSNESAVGAY